MSTALDLAIVSAFDALQGFANQENFWDLFETAFGQGYDRSRVEELRSQWQAGDSEVFPIVEPGNVGNSVGGLWLEYGGHLPLGGFGNKGYGVCLAGGVVGRIWAFCGCSGE